MYAGQLYDKYMTQKHLYRYGKKLHRLPKPKCICFYNGTDKQPEEKILRLSEAFGADDGDIEVVVRLLNVNYGCNMALMETCRVLHDYSGFIDSIRRNKNAGMSLDEAVDTAIEATSDDSLLKKFLVAQRAEVKGMYLTEYDEEEERKLGREEAREEGLEEGRAEGRAKGLAEGRIKGIAEGITKGIRENSERVAAAMLRKNFPLTLIEEISQLSEDVIRTIAANLGISIA